MAAIALITHRADGGNRTLDASSLVVLTDSGFAMYCQCMSDRLTKKKGWHIRASRLEDDFYNSK